MNAFVIALFILAVYMTIKDYKVIKRHGSFKTYSTLIEPVYNDSTEEFLKLVDDYIANEKMEEFVNKAKILKFFSFIKENRDGYKELLDDIDLNSIFLDNKGVVDKTKEMLNSDAYFWFLVSAIEADVHSNRELLNDLLDKTKTYENTLGQRLYYQMILAYLNAALGDESAIHLFKRVLDGDYYEFVYAKDLIGIFKKLATAILVFKGVEINEEDYNNLYSFAKGQAGEFVLKEMNLFDQYAEVTTEENK